MKAWMSEKFLESSLIHHFSEHQICFIGSFSFFRHHNTVKHDAKGKKNSNMAIVAKKARVEGVEDQKNHPPYRAFSLSISPLKGWPRFLRLWEMANEVLLNFQRKSGPLARGFRPNSGSLRLTRKCLSPSSLSSLFSPFFLLLSFLDATTHLYKRSCPSVRASVGPSVGPSVRPSVCPVLFSNDEKRPFRCTDDDEIWDDKVVASFEPRGSCFLGLDLKKSHFRNCTMK